MLVKLVMRPGKNSMPTLHTSWQAIVENYQFQTLRNLRELAKFARFEWLQMNVYSQILHDR